MEACERFSFYGMVSILMLYLKNTLGMGEGPAKETLHLFKTGVYFLPLFGGLIADRWLGRYRTILWLSLFYCLGHGWIAVTDASQGGLMVGLALIAIGAGGIKPCVSAFVGDQYPPGPKERLARVYGLFYASINFGAFFGFALIPWIRDQHGHRWAFGIPGLFMGVATLVFYAGSRHYIRIPVPPEANREQANPHGTSDWRDVGKVALVLSPVPVFWALYDQINTSWVVQGERMVPFHVLGYRVDGERMQSFSALLVLAWVPILTLGIYPWLARRGCTWSPLSRMKAGFGFAMLSFLACALIQRHIEGGATPSLTWQILQYTVLELGEVLVSATGLEFAYGHAPARHRGFVMSLWLLCTALGNFLVAALTRLNTTVIKAAGSTEFLLYAALMAAATVAFAIIARLVFPQAGSAPQDEDSSRAH